MSDEELGLPFREAIRFLRQKVRLPSRAWTELRESAHARSFVVAGAIKDQLLADFQNALIEALEEGKTLQEFRKDFDRIVAAHGWSYRGRRGWRSGVIYNTNMRMARAAGRWAQIQQVKAARPYIRYFAVLDSRTRPLHRDWHDVVLPVDHPFWKTHLPPNGWNCRCTIQSLSERDLKRRKLKVTDPAPAVQTEARQVRTPEGFENWPTPKGIDTGFGYNVGHAWLHGAVPPPLQSPLPQAQGINPPLPRDLDLTITPTPVDPDQLLPDGLSDEEYVNAFLGEFRAGIGRPRAVRDRAGHLVAVGEDLFIDRRRSAEAGETVYKVRKGGRERYTLLMADALKEPDEIWLHWRRDPNTGRYALSRRYLKAWDLPGRGGAYTSFTWTDDGWVGVTSFPPDRESYLLSQREGALLYKRKS